MNSDLVFFCQTSPCACHSSCRIGQMFFPGGSPPLPFRPGNPALSGSCPLVTPYYCRLGDLLFFVFMSAYCMFDLSVYYLFLQYFDTVGWVFWAVKTVSHITYSPILCWRGHKTLLNPILAVAGSHKWPLNQSLVSFALVCVYVSSYCAWLFTLFLVIAMFNISHVIGWEGWLFCTSWEIRCEDCLHNCGTCYTSLSQSTVCLVIFSRPY